MMTILVILTWVCIALGFFVNPAFFLLGVIIFLLVAVWWTVLALKQKMDWKTIFIVWAIPIILFLAFGFAVMFFPPLSGEKMTDD